MSVSSNRGINMLPRDWELLEFLEEQGFASFQQLNRRFFSSKNSTCSMRLKKLENNQYISQKILFDFFRNNTSELKQGYFPHLLNLNIKPNQKIYFVNRGYSKGYGKSRKLFKPSMVLHQLMLNEVRDFLDDELVYKILLNDPKIQILSSIQLGRHHQIVPDLCYEHDKIRVAIELERTAKGMTRYFKRFSYFRDSIYSHVIYYYANENQLQNLLKRAGSTRKFAFAHYKFPNELYSNVFGPLRLNDFIHKTTGVMGAI